jgi:predicted Zn-dependent protease
MSELLARYIQEEEGVQDKSLQWDIYSQTASDTEVHLRDNKIESIRSPIRSQGYAIRIIRQKESSSEGEQSSGVGIAPGNLLDDEKDVRRTLRLANEASKITSAPSFQIPSYRMPLPRAKISDSKISKDQLQIAKDLAESVISLLDKENDIRVTFCKIRLTEIATKLENFFGLSLEKSETFAYFEAGLSPGSAEGRGLAEYWPHTLVRRIEDLDLEKSIPKWATFARDSAKATIPETGRYALITPPYVLSEMLPAVVSFQSSASSLKKGMSRWRVKGEKVWSNKVTITDSGLLDFGLATSPFDDEGIPQRETPIVTRGEFQNHITNNMYAKFVSPKESTGNGIKSSRINGILCYNDSVGIEHTNVVMDGGDSSFEEMIKETRSGILMEQFSWMLPDPVSGSFGAEIRHAYLVVNGAIKVALKGGVVNGSFFDAQGSIEGEIEKGIFNSLDLVSKERHNANASLLPFTRFPEIRISGR